MNKLISDLCSKCDNVTMLGCDSFLDSAHRLRYKFSRDVVHLNENGIAHIVKKFKEYVHDNIKDTQTTRVSYSKHRSQGDYSAALLKLPFNSRDLSHNHV